MLTHVRSRTNFTLTLRRRTACFGSVAAMLVPGLITPPPALAQPIAWTLEAAAGPSPRASHAMVYDSARAVTLLFGGRSGGDQTWEWNGTAWTQRMVSGPSARYAFAMAYDTARGVTVLFGGFVNTTPHYLDQTWEWDGAAWTWRTVPGPAGRIGHAMAYDAARGVTVLFGGYVGAPIGVSDETWEWDGNSWTLRPVAGPSPRQEHAMVYDSARAVTVLFGGYDPFSDETWEWDGSTWARRLVAAPPPRSVHAMAYDAARAVTVLFGGAGDPPSDYMGDTWEWDGAAWTQSLLSGPSARYGHAMAYDSARTQIVLFGGYDNAHGPSGETWLLGDACAVWHITVQPLPQTLTPGSPATFTVRTTDPAAAYQWRRNETDLADDSRISGATSDTLTIADVQSGDQGDYDCIISGECGTLTSTGAELSCRAVFTQHPAAADVYAGQQIILVAAHAPAAIVTYQWKRNDADLLDSPVYSGVNTPTLTINSTDRSQSGDYTLAVTNECGVATSAAAPVQVRCVGDFDNDGGIDGKDVSDFFAAWESGQSSGDVNGDGGIDGSDVQTFFDRWEQGVC